MIKAFNGVTLSGGKTIARITDERDRRRLLITEPGKPDLSLPDWEAGWACLPGLNARKDYYAFAEEVPGKDPGGYHLRFTNAPGVPVAGDDKLFIVAMRASIADYVARGLRNGLSIMLWIHQPGVFGDKVRAIDNRLLGLKPCKACDGTGNEFAGASVFRSCSECAGTGGVKGTGIGRTTSETH